MRSRSVGGTIRPPAARPWRAGAVHGRRRGRRRRVRHLGVTRSSSVTASVAGFECAATGSGATSRRRAGSGTGSARARRPAPARRARRPCALRAPAGCFDARGSDACRGVPASRRGIGSCARRLVRVQVVPSPSGPCAACAGLAVLTRRGGGSDGRSRLRRLGRLLRRGVGFLPFCTGVSAKMSPVGNVMFRCFARRSTNCRATTSSIVLDALFTSMPWSRFSSAVTSWLVVPRSSATL